jgi:hypothetical protein
VRKRFSAKGLLGGLLPVLLLGSLVVIDIPLCPAKNLFGVPCPGCGLTRATAALLGGDWSAAFALHPLFPVIVPLVAWTVLRTVLVSAGLIPSHSFDPIAKLPRWFWLAFGVLLFGVWALRLAGHLGGHPDGLHPELGALTGPFF